MHSTQANRTASGTLDRGDVPGGGGAADRGDEPDEAAHGADGQDGLDRGPRPVPPPVRQGVADHGGHHREHRTGRAQLALAPAGADGDDHRGRRGHPEGHRVLGRTRACWPGPPAATGSRGFAPGRSADRSRRSARAAEATGTGRRRAARVEPPPQVDPVADHPDRASASRVPSTTGRPRARYRPSAGHHPFRLGLGGHAGRRAGPARRPRGRRSGARSPAPSALRRGRSPASGPTGGCRRAGRAGPPGARRPRTVPAAGRRPIGSSGGRRAAAGLRRAGAPRAAAGAGGPRPPGPTTAARTARDDASSTTTASSTPRRAGVTVTVDRAGRRGLAPAGPVRRARSDSRGRTADRPVGRHGQLHRPPGLAVRRASRCR